MLMGQPHADGLAAMLVPLDVILDTRMGTIAKFGIEAYKQVHLSGYYSRRSDHFEGIDSKEYFRLYRERDAVTLSMSTITHMVGLIKDFVSKVHIASATSPVQRVPRVDINLFPYEPPQAVIELLERAIRIHIDDRFDMSFVRYSPSDLHYDLVKYTYDHMVMYDIGPWITAQAQDWKRRGKAHSEMTVFIPILAHTRNQEDVPSSLEQMSTEFEKLFSPLMNIYQLPVYLYCQAATPFSGLNKEGIPGAKAPGIVEEKIED